jgi:outer membrane protein
VKLINTIFPLALILSANAQASEDFTNSIQGDLGIFANVSSNPIRGVGNSSTVLPYAYFDYGRVFTRIDTFGVKTVPVGYGHLELVGRIKFDGYQTAGIAELNGITDRQNPAPIGIGTFQLTPIGAFFLYAFYDANSSHGNIYEAVYAAKFPLGEMAVYPQLGIEQYSSDYTQYYYGVSAAESVASGYASYTPTASTNRSFRIMFEVPLNYGWFADFYLQRKWLGAAITGSPLVNTQFADNGFAALVYHFK